MTAASLAVGRAEARPQVPPRCEPPAASCLTLHPGDVACVDRGTRLATLLGSCVSIVLADPRRSIGAMCHYVHASRFGGAASALRPTARAAEAFAAMCAALRARGIEPLRCDAWVYGGGNMFPGLSPAEEHVGAANAQWALDELVRLGVRIVDADVGGRVYRKIHWAVGAADPVVASVSV
jgi:chemotaxis protein CheD